MWRKIFRIGKTISIFVAYVLHCHFAIGQSYFNKVLTIGGDTEIGAQTLPFGNQQYIGLAEEASLYIPVLYILDSMGDTTFTRFLTTEGKYFSTLIGGFQRRNDGVYFNTGTHVDTSLVISAYLLSYDTAGSIITLDTFQFGKFLNCNGLAFCSDGGFAMTGYVQLSNNDFQLFVLKLDSTRQQEWLRFYGGSPEEFGLTIEQFYDGGFIIGGGKEFSIDLSNYWVIRMDSLGTMIWQLNYGTPFNNGGCYAKVVSDSNIILCGGIDFGNTKEREAYICKISYLNADTIWENTISYTGSQDFSIDVIELADKTIIAAGNNYYENAVILAKFTASGKKIWLRQLKSPVMNLSHGYGISSTPDKGFIISGTEYGGDGSQDIWLLKLDSIGCPYPNCGPVISLDDLQGRSLLLYPNPGGDEISVIGSNETGRVLTLTDAGGRRVWQGGMDDYGYFRPAGVAPGIYVWELYDCEAGVIKGSSLARGKWLKVE